MYIIYKYKKYKIIHTIKYKNIIIFQYNSIYIKNI